MEPSTLGIQLIVAEAAVLHPKSQSENGRLRRAERAATDDIVAAFSGPRWSSEIFELGQIC